MTRWSARRILMPALLVTVLVTAAEVSAGCQISGDPQTPSTGDVFVGGNLTEGYDIGLDTDQQRRDWLACEKEVCEDCCRMAFPDGQAWGAVFLTVGTPAQPPRPARDFRGYTALQFELRGAEGEEHVAVGIKDACDPDDGTEVKIDRGPLSTAWRTYGLALERLSSADASQLYVLTEFVFDPIGNANPARTVFFRNVRFTRTQCGDADVDGTIRVTDGVQALRAAVQLPSDCVARTCDTDGSGTIGVTDATQILRAAAGLPVQLACNEGD